MAVASGKTATGYLFADAPVPTSVSGSVFSDVNVNGKRDATEAGLAGWLVYADTNNNGQFDPGETSVVTDGKGNYVLTLPAGTYTIRMQVRSGYYETSPHLLSYTAVLTPGHSVIGDLFGAKAIAPV